MGWYYGIDNSKSDVIREVTADTSFENGTSRTLRKCVKGNVLWSVREVNFKDGKVQRFIECNLLDKSEGNWGYKPMDESMGPYYYTCPLPYLDMVPVANEKWRSVVREHHARIASGKDALRSLAIGDVVVLKKGHTPSRLTLASKKPLRGYAGNMLFRFPAKAIDPDETLKANAEPKESSN
jgi:hypothetical protein